MRLRSAALPRLVVVFAGIPVLLLSCWQVVRQRHEVNMTLKIAKSVVETSFGDFAAAVEAHRQALLAHRFTGDAAPTAPAPVRAGGAAGAARWRGR